MLILRLTTALFLLTAGVLAANKTAGESCTATDTCTFPDSYCDAGQTKTCQCNTGFALAGSTCARVHGQACDASMCAHQDMICKDNKCACDTTANVKAGSANDDTCECADSYTRRSSDSKCVKNLTQACTADADCVDNAECSSQKKCACKTGYKVITSEETRCTACADGYVEESGVCNTISGESCTPSANTCVNNSTCTLGTGTTKGTCICNDADNVMADTITGKCKCKANYGLTAAGKCALVDGQECSAATDKCVDNAVCKTRTNEQVQKCTCDDTKLYVADPSRTKLCVCDSAKAWEKDGKCYLRNGQQCSNVAECYPAPGKVCRAVTNGGDTVCTCDENKHIVTVVRGVICKCADTYIREGDDCLIKAGEGCTAATDTCITNSICSGSPSTCKCNDEYPEYFFGRCAKKLKEVGDACKTTKDADPCTTHAICDKLTKKCVCDLANNVKSSTGAGCVATIGQSCMGKDTPNLCVSGATCKDNSTTPWKDFVCTCKGTVQDDGTCGAAAVVTSLVVLMAGLLVTSRFV
ncbi:cell death abnormality protein 1-like isoform X2 [Littorina saxatilis]|uniref:cell death abnormality protein 1-like isoform X2 n=1 Tax=Littorina saxatilis TaxID=31220 RepID=UPI0038B68ADA